MSNGTCAYTAEDGKLVLVLLIFHNEVAFFFKQVTAKEHMTPAVHDWNAKQSCQQILGES